jgi:NAD(P)-dependent dehydrogenase (short-subunit alcohol dehydrogenase family)
MNNPLVLVTGATDGIGAETARLLAARGARVIVHGRDADKAARVAASIGSTQAPAIADLSRMEAVRTMAQQLVARGEPIDVVLHNAGIFATRRVVTEDGFESTLAVNHFAPFLLTHLLLEPLRASKQGRVIFVSSIAHQRGALDVEDFSMARGFTGYGAYAASKLGNVLSAIEIARRLKSTPITANALHPGVVSTKLLRAGFSMEGPDSHEDGAATSVFLALDDSVARTTGRYFVRSREASHAGDASAARALYEKSCAALSLAPLP